MDEKERAYLRDEDLSEADQVLLRLYDESREDPAWDESDEAILAFASSIHERPEDEEGTPETAIPEASNENPPTERSDESETTAQGDNVVAFAPRRRSTPVTSFFRSPVAGFSIAASLMIGLFAGQGLSPYVNLGVAPDYQDLVQENRQLTRSLSAGRSIRLRDPETPQGGGETPRPAAELAAIPALLGDFDCADLSLTFSRQGKIQLSGHVASLEDMERLQGGLSGLRALGEIRNDVRVYGWPFCQALEIMAAADALGAAGAAAPQVRPFNHDTLYLGGEMLVVEAITGDRFDGYVYVDFLQNDGNVVHMLPFDRRPDNKVAAGGRVLLGSDGMEYQLAAPYGTEMLIVITSPVPLFDGLRPEVERAEDYFPALRQALEKRASEGYAGKLLGSYEFLTTKAK